MGVYEALPADRRGHTGGNRCHLSAQGTSGSSLEETKKKKKKKHNNTHMLTQSNILIISILLKNLIWLNLKN